MKNHRIMEKKEVKINPVSANFDLRNVAEIKKKDRKKYEKLMWYVIDGLRLYDLWNTTCVKKDGETILLDQLHDQLYWRYDVPVLQELVDFIRDKAKDIYDAIYIVSEKDEDGVIIYSPLNMDCTSQFNWCCFAAGLGESVYKTLITNPDNLKRVCLHCRGWNIENITHPILEVIDEKK